MFMLSWNFRRSRVARKVRKLSGKFLCARLTNTFKIVVVGCKDCGKTSVVRRYVGDTFYESKNDPLVKSFTLLTFLEVSNKMREFETEIIELSSNELKTKNGKKQFASADGYVLVYEKNNGDSLKQLKKRLKELTTLKKDSSPIVLLENKADLCSDEVDGKYSSQDIRAEYQHFSVSAKTNTNILEAFDALQKSFLLQKKYVRISS
ncbi:uncharacterized protein LOC130642236 [Hydractinia symbiolongicarpus]|uniref:uncharacterized protein LOC130642236 n=1 Tax=Hydractinia symbiolongicarpus TaxID=13093 RepID=UPI00254EFF2B|nr:uncharacterized protein LOC130642236 [Hydractinia symbiolongicarpus]